MRPSALSPLNRKMCHFSEVELGCLNLLEIFDFRLVREVIKSIARAMFSQDSP